MFVMMNKEIDFILNVCQYLVLIGVKLSHS